MARQCDTNGRVLRKFEKRTICAYEKSVRRFEGCILGQIDELLDQVSSG